MKTRITVLTFGMIALLLSASPVTFAKENGNKGQGENKQKVQVSAKVEKSKNQEDSEDKNQGENNKDQSDQGENGSSTENSCFRAFGHLIAPGWIKHNGQIDIGDECRLPFGIGRHFRGNNASTTPDVTAPVISAITWKPALKQAEVRWTTDEKSDSTVFYSSTTPVSTDPGSVNQVTRNSLVKDHRLVIRHLAPSTTYYVIVRSRDAAGNTSLSGTQSFTTTAPAADTQAPVISNIVTLTSTSTIQVGWKTNENATGRVYYSTVLPVNLSTAPFVDSTLLTTNHLSTILGLNQSTTYYLVVESTDGSGNVSTSATFTASTGAATTTDTTPPAISNVTTSVGSTTVGINWTTDEFATSKIFYSTTTPVNTTSSTTLFVSNLSLSTNHPMTISGLATSTLYHFVIQSADASNNTASTAEFSTTTLAL